VTEEGFKERYQKEAVDIMNARMEQYSGKPEEASEQGPEDDKDSAILDEEEA